MHHTIVLWVVLWQYKNKRKAFSSIVPYYVNAKWKKQVANSNKGVLKPTLVAEDSRPHYKISKFNTHCLSVVVIKKHAKGQNEVMSHNSVFLAKMKISKMEE